MSAKVLQIRPQNGLVMLDTLRAMMESGEVVEVICVTVTPEPDGTFEAWWGSASGCGVKSSHIAMASVYLAERALIAAREP